MKTAASASVLVLISGVATAQWSSYPLRTSRFKRTANPISVLPFLARKMAPWICQVSGVFPTRLRGRLLKYVLSRNLF
jgi:hypothetical protein